MDGGAQFKYLFLGSSFPGFTIDFYSAGTLTGKNVWVDENKSSAVQQVSADSNGMTFWYADGDYRMRIKDADGTLMWDWDKVKITSDTATMWEGNYGLSYPLASATNIWQLFARHDASNKFLELGINNGTGFVPITDTVNARRFGTDGTAIQDAINSLTRGLVIIPYLADGWTITSAITGKSGVYVKGQGLPTLKQDAADIYLFDLSNVIDTGIKGLKFDGNGYGTSETNAVNSAIYSKDTSSLSKNLRISKNYFTNLYYRAITINGPAAGSYSTEVYVKDNILDDMVDEGIGLYYIKQAEISHNKLRDHAKEGIKVSTSDDVIISHNQIYHDNTVYGPSINVGENSDNISVSVNRAYQGSIGIGIENGNTKIEVIGNRLTGQGTRNIGVSIDSDDDDTNDIVIANNICKDSAGSQNIRVIGRAAKKLGTVILNGNICSTVTGSGPNIQVSYVTTAIITNNDCKSATKEGIDVNNTEVAIIKGNDILNAKFDGIEVVDTTYAEIEGNVIIDPSQTVNYNGIDIAATVTVAACSNNIIKDANSNMLYGIRNLATNPIMGQSYITGYTNAAVYIGTMSKNSNFINAGQLGVANSAAGDVTGTAKNYKVQVFDASGNSLGYLQVYGG